MGAVLHHPLLLPEESPQISTQLKKEHEFPPDSLSEAVLFASVYAAGAQSMKGQASCGMTKNRPSQTDATQVESI